MMYHSRNKQHTTYTPGGTVEFKFQDRVRFRKANLNLTDARGRYENAPEQRQQKNRVELGFHCGGGFQLGRAMALSSQTRGFKAFD